MKTVLALVLLALLVPLGQGISSPDWTLTVDNPSPYLGDVVNISVSTVFPAARDYLLIEVHDPHGVTVDSNVTQLDERNHATVLWISSLSSEPGIYEIRVYFRNAFVANTTINLVYDELDYLAKKDHLQDLRLAAQERYNHQTRIVANAAYNLDISILKWVSLAVVTSIANIVLLFRVGIFAYVEANRSKGPDSSGIRKFWYRAWAPQTDGNLTMIDGHGDMIDKVPEHARGRYCPTCARWVREAEVAVHVHFLPPPPAAAAPPAPPAQPPAKAAPQAPVRPVVRRVIRRRVAGPPRQVASASKEMVQ